MVVCVCRVVTDSAIREAVADGAADVDDVVARTGATTGCGACSCAVEELVQKACEGGSGSKCSDCPRKKERLWSPYLDSERAA